MAESRDFSFSFSNVVMPPRWLRRVFYVVGLRSTSS
jgi:hypothetical protein